MDRRDFLIFAALTAVPLMTGVSASARSVKAPGVPYPPVMYYFKKPKGGVPNSVLPVLVYPEAVLPEIDDKGDYLEKLFASNGWLPAWRCGIYPFTHYHSNTHEVVGVCSGSAELEFGGSGGRLIKVTSGDVVLIPAGIGHRQIFADSDFLLVGAYPAGISPDMMRDEEKNMAEAVKRIEKVYVPETDPVLGSRGLKELWR